MKWKTLLKKTNSENIKALFERLKITLFYVLALVTIASTVLLFWPSGLLFAKRLRVCSKNVAMEKGIRNSKTNIAAFLFRY